MSVDGCSLEESPAVLSEIELPGWQPYPVAVTATAEHLWVTTRGTTSLLRISQDLQIRRWRLPRWPHTAAIDDDGRVWTALTWRGRVAVVDPAGGRTSFVRLARSREILGIALGERSAYVVDSANRLLWNVDRRDLSPSRRAIPGSIRPDIPLVDRSGRVWITDTQRPALTSVDETGDEWTELPVADGTRLLVEREDGTIACTASSRPLLVVVDPRTRSADALALPGVPFGVASAPTATAVAIPDQDAVVLINSAGSQVVKLPRGSAPHDVAWWGDRLAVTCPGRSAVYLLAT